MLQGIRLILSIHPPNIMSEVIIYKASAGSGKTWQLTYEYLRILFSKPEDYKHILAVTFTNKATEEMRNRILEELRQMAAGEKTHLARRLVEEGIAYSGDLEKKASHILRILLHNFSKFTVTTIDSFFQHILKSFAREAGIPFYRELILDDKMVLEETIDQLFFHLNEHPFLQEWLVDFTLERIRQGSSWNVHKEVSRLGNEILRESYPGTLATEQPTFTDDQRKEWQGQLFGKEKKLKENLIEIGQQACQIAKRFGLSQDDFAGKSRSVFAYFEQLANGTMKDLTDTILSALTDETKWFSKTSAKKELIRQAMDEGMQTLLARSVDILRELNKIQALARNFYVWAILSDLAGLLQKYLAEQNLHLLSDTHKILYHLIGRNDAPFIYERAGNTWLYYMIDEFQDTSSLQWNNFRPLIANSLSQGKTSLVVGDVKQSIYRWRNSDWRILAREIMHDFPGRNKTEVLPLNRRSFRNIIEFNNAFFFEAIDCLKDKYCEQTSLNTEHDLVGLMKEAYEDCRQGVPEDKMQTTGFVRVELYDAKTEESRTPLRLVETVCELFSSGYRPEDVAILVRTKNEAKAVASWLLNTDYYPPGIAPPGIITEEAILLSQSPVVRILCSLLRYLKNLDDQLNNLSLLNELFMYLEMQLPDGREYPPVTFTRETTENFLPPEFVSQAAELKKLPLQILCGRLASLFGLDRKEQQKPYLFSFMDQVNEAVRKGISDVYGFLDFWDKNAGNLSLTIPEKANAVRIMTIHKAKGLEFPVVILPDPVWCIDHNPTQPPYLWIKQNLFGNEECTWFPVRYGKQLAQTDFRETWLKEKMQTFVDNLNLLYVAFTRAREGLIVISDKDDKLYNARNLIMDVCSRLNDTIVQKQEEDGKIICCRGSFPEPKAGTLSKGEPFHAQDNDGLFATRFALLVKKHASGYFSEKGELVQTARDEGKLMHTLLSKIRHAEDVPAVVQQAVLEGKISKNEAETIQQRIALVLADPEMKEYFTDAWKILTENDIVLPGGETKRPDRIMVNQEKTVVIDYKFGEQARPYHIRQVKEYMELLAEAGFPSPCGIVWYPHLNRKERIDL